MQDVRVDVSVVIPCYDEEGSVAELCDEIFAALPSSSIEVIFVDDGSKDASWSRIQRLCERRSEVHGVRLRRNAGKSTALQVGFSQARGKIVCTMDADGQDAPENIPRLVAKLEEGWDVVCGWRRERKDPWRKRFLSRIFNRLVSTITGVRLHDHNCGLKVYRAEVLEEIVLLGELHRFMGVLADARGFRVTEDVVLHRPRKSGVSKFGSERFLRGLYDLFTVRYLIAYGSRAHHPVGLVGAFLVVVGLVVMSYLAGTWVVRLWEPDAFEPLSKRPLLLYGVVSTLLGGQMIALSLVIAMILSHRTSGADRPPVAETTKRKKRLERKLEERRAD